MLKTQIDNYDMYLAVENHFDDNPTLWNTNVPVDATKTLLSTELDILATQIALQLIDPTGITVDKDKARMTLETEAFTLSAAISGFASVTGRSDLYNRTNYNKTTLSRYRDAELVGVCTNLSADCTTELASLAPYGVAAAQITSFNSAIANFGTIMKNPTEAIAKRKLATDKIQEKITGIAILLSTRLDNLMVGLRATQPVFVDTYTNLRAINSTGSHPLSLTITTLNAKTNEPIPHVKLEIVGEGITRTSSARGYNTVINLVAGEHTITATNPKYVHKSEHFIIVSGETTELVLLLDAI